MKTVSIALWISAMSLAFVAGYVIRGEGVFSSGDTRLTLEEKQEVADSASRKVSGTLHSQSLDNAASNTNVVSKPDQITQIPGHITFFSLLDKFNTSGSTMSTDEFSAFVGALSHIDQHDIINALQNWDISIFDPQSNVIFSVLVMRFSELDPLGAVEYALSTGESKQAKHFLTHSVMSQWARRSPQEALSWFFDREHNGQSPEHQLLVSGLFSALAQTDLTLALESVNSLEDTKAKQSAYQAIGLALESAEQYSTFITELSNRGDTSNIETALSRWSFKDINAVTDWYATLGDDKVRETARRTIFSQYIFQEPSQAADWYMRESTRETAQRDVEHIASRWVFSDPEQALGWVSGQQNIDTPKAELFTLTAASYHFPDFAEQHLDSISGMADKISLAHAIYRGYKQKSADDANAFVESFVYKEALKERIANVENGPRRR